MTVPVWHQCIATTRKGKPCSIPGEQARGGFCHVHDPHGLAQQNILEMRATGELKTRKRTKARYLFRVSEERRTQEEAKQAQNKVKSR